MLTFPKPIESLEPSEARKQPTPTDAVMKIIKDKKLEVDSAPIGLNAAALAASQAGNFDPNSPWAARRSPVLSK